MECSRPIGSVFANGSPIRHLKNFHQGVELLTALEETTVDGGEVRVRWVDRSAGQIKCTR